MPPDFLALARSAAAESAVLLKNEGVLPLKKKEGIALIGPFADSKEIIGGWSCNADNKLAVTVRTGLEEAGAKFTYAAGCGDALDETDTSGIEEAVKAAQESETVLLCLGESMRYSGECKSRTDLTLSPRTAGTVQARLCRQ